MMKSNFEIERESKTITKRFDFLDGYRAILSFILVINHARLSLNCLFLFYICSLAQKCAITGFFLVSSFLLTYQLLADFRQTNSISISIMKYLIRLFVRYYVLYVSVAYCLLHGPKCLSGYYHDSFVDMWKLITLDYPGPNHLWIFSPLLKFSCLVIPLFCCSVRLLKEAESILLVASMCWTLYDQVYNCFGIEPDEILFGSGRAYHSMRNNFATLFIGSQLALAYYLVVKNSELFRMRFIKHNWILFFINVSSIVIAFYSMTCHSQYFLQDNHDFTFRSRPAIFWSVFLFMLLICENASIGNLFLKLFESRILRTGGRAYLSIYLLHPAATHLARSFDLFTRFKLSVVLSVLFSYFLGLLFNLVIEIQLKKLSNYLCTKLDSFIKFIKHETNDNITLLSDILPI